MLEFQYDWDDPADPPTQPRVRTRIPSLPLRQQTPGIEARAMNIHYPGGSPSIIGPAPIERPRAADLNNPNSRASGVNAGKAPRPRCGPLFPMRTSNVRSH
jgi:hypothetical protein